MRKYYLLLITVFISVIGFAQKRNESDALEIASSYFNGKHKSILGRDAIKRVYISDGTNINKSPMSGISDSPAFYVFNNSDNAFVIVSGDERMPEILGYSDNGAFVADNLPENVRNWFDYYERAYNALDSGLIEKSVSYVGTADFLPSVDPLLGGIEYNQDAPYNNLCPQYEGYTCPTGCVATAIASIVRYYKYPERGIGQHNYTTTTYDFECSFDFENTVFDWDNILETYNGGESIEQKEAVATLMKACGVAMDMDYMPNASGAFSYMVPERISKYFGYNSNMLYVERNYYQSSEWISFLKTELNQNRPVYYSGASDSGGHAFVIDGYDENGLFHVNWGWGGHYNGYFELLTLAPAGSGIGGGSDLDGFRFDQAMVLNFQPADSEYAGSCLYADKMYISKVSMQKGEKFTLRLTNFYNKTNAFNGNIAIILEKDSQQRVLFEYSVELPAFSGFSEFPVELSIPKDCEDGFYELYVATKDNREDDWSRIKLLPGDIQDLYVEIKGDDCVFGYPEENVAEINTDFTVNGDAVSGANINVGVNIVNNGGKEFYGKVVLLLLSEDLSVIESVWGGDVLYLDRGNDKTLNYNIDLRKFDENNQEINIPEGIYNLSLARHVNGMFYLVGGVHKITIEGEPELEVGSYSVEHSLIVKGDDFRVNLDVVAVNGDFNGFYAGFLLNANYEQIDVISVSEISLKEGQKQNVTMSYNTSGLNPGTYYFAFSVSKTMYGNYSTLCSPSFKVLGESEIDVEVSVAELQTSLTKGEDALFGANVTAVGSGTFVGNVYAAICTYKEGEGYYIVDSTEQKEISVNAGETQRHDFVISTSGISPGEYFYIIVIGDLVYCSIPVQIVEPEVLYNLDFSEVEIVGLGVVAGQNISLGGVLRNTGTGDFTGTCSMFLFADSIVAKNNYDIVVPAGGECNVEHIILETEDVVPGTYNLGIKFISIEGEEFVFSAKATIVAKDAVDVYVDSGSLDKELYKEGDKINFRGIVKAIGTGTYDGLCAAYVYDRNNNIVKNSYAKPLSLEAGDYVEINIELSTFALSPGSYTYVIFLSDDKNFVSKRYLYFTVESGTPVDVRFLEPSLSDTEAELGDTLTFNVTMYNVGSGTFDGNIAGSFVANNTILQSFSKENKIIEGGESLDVLMDVPVKDLVPGVNTFAFLVAYSVDEQYYSYYTCEITVKEGVVSIGEIQKVTKPVVCSAQSESNIRLLTGIALDRINVYSQSGQVVGSVDCDGLTGEVVIPAENIRDGIYIVEAIASDNSRYVIKTIRK